MWRVCFMPGNRFRGRIGDRNGFALRNRTDLATSARPAVNDQRVRDRELAPRLGHSRVDGPEPQGCSDGARRATSTPEVGSAWKTMQRDKEDM